MLVFGYSGITEKFIDFAFEMAQVSGYKLNITVVSDDTNAKINIWKPDQRSVSSLVLMTK